LNGPLIVPVTPEGVQALIVPPEIVPSVVPGVFKAEDSRLDASV
jgi:hypothetical protein